MDEKGRTRLRINTALYCSTVVFTRYWPGDKMHYSEDNGIGELIPVVYDFEKATEDDEESSIIWQKEDITEKDRKEAIDAGSDLFGGGPCRWICEKWLDGNYPDWRDPTAYWSK